MAGVDDTAPPSRITVSRDALRADLAEMELRLRLYFDDQLRHKADAGPVYELIAKVDALDRGDFTESHRRALVELITAQTAERQAAAWSWRERAMAVVSAAVTLASLLLALVIAFKGGIA